MEVVINKDVESKLQALTKRPAANQSAAQQVKFLQAKITQQQTLLQEYAHEPVRRPSKAHKAIKKELRLLESKLKEINKVIAKCNALKTAGSLLGIKHGKVVLKKTEYTW